jgi:hypothetical protein
MLLPCVRTAAWLLGSSLLFAAGAALSACGGDTGILLTVTGEAGAGHRLHYRVVGLAGPWDREERVSAKAGEGEGEREGERKTAARLQVPIELPIPASASEKRIGVFAWVTDDSGRVVARGVSPACMLVTPRVMARYELRLVAVEEGFSPDMVSGCRCQAEDPKAPMCPQLASPPGPDPEPPEPGPGPSPGPTPDAGMSPEPGPDAGAPPPPRDASATPPVDARSPAPVDTRPPAEPDAAPPAPPPPGGGTNDLFSFEVARDWTSAETMVSLDSAQVTHGKSALAFSPRGQVFIRSREFATGELPQPVSAKLALDVFVAEQQGNEHSLQLWFECREANVYNAYIEYKGLGMLTAGQYTTLEFTLPDRVVSALGGQHTGCKFWMQHTGRGLTRYDRMAFGR